MEFIAVISNITLEFTMNLFAFLTIDSINILTKHTNIKNQVLTKEVHLFN